MASTAASAHPFTCNTCQVAFRSSDLQRTHMQSDWHRYNLKRRVASLPPLTSEIFAEKVLANKASAAATAARASFEKKCDPCDKVFFSEGAFVNHVGSQKHKNAAARYGRYTKAVGDQATETESMTGSTFSLGEPLETGSAREEMEDEEMDEVAERMNASGLQEAKNPVFGKNQGQNNAMDVEQPNGAGGVMGANAANKMEIDEEYEHEADVNQCLFCNYVSPTMDLNVNHMGKQHGWFVPEMEFLVDMKGLINYLSETIQVLHQCLYCHKQVHTSAGVQTHMRDRGHCMIAYSTEDEQMDVGEFYDFRATYEDSDSEDEDDETEGGVNLGKKRATKTTITNENGEEETDSEEDDEGWESDGSDDDSSVATDEITSVPVDRKPRKPSRQDGKHKASDGYHSHAHAHNNSQAVYRDEFELHLPSGRTAGHRNLRTYYRQNLHNYPTPEQRLEQQLLANEERHDSDGEDDVDENGKQIVRSGRDRKGRALVTRGKLGMVGVSDEKKKEIAAVEKRQLKRIQRQQAQYQWGNDKRGNSQKHFRDPLLQ